jgi:hypothetical protein
MKITPKQLKNLIKEEIMEVLELDTDVWSSVEELKMQGMTPSGIMLELNRVYTSGAAGADVSERWNQWLDYAGMTNRYVAQSGDIESWQQFRGATGLAADIQKIIASRRT